MIRRLAPDEVTLLKELRLGALAESPTAFGSTYEGSVDRGDDVWRHLLRPDGNPTFVGEDARGGLGLAVAAPDDTDPAVVHLYSMWVAPAARGEGIGDALVERVLRWATDHGADRVRLDVVADNGPARRLYERHGFVSTGRSEIRDRDGVLEVEMETVVPGRGDGTTR